MGLKLESLLSYDAQIRHGYCRDRQFMDTAMTRTLHIKSDVSDMIRHDMLPILKYLCIIAPILVVSFPSPCLLSETFSEMVPTHLHHTILCIGYEGSICKIFICETHYHGCLEAPFLF